jgi:TonB family protein
VPPALLEPPPPKRHRQWWRSRSVWAGSLVIVLAPAAAAAIWAWPRPEGRWLRSGVEQLSQASRAAGRTVIQTVNRGVEAANWRFRSRPPQPEPSVLVLADEAPPRAPGLGQSITLEGGARAPAIPPFQLAKTPLRGGSEPLAAAPDPGSVPLPAASPGPAPGPVFSAGDPLVVPPRLASPRASARARETGSSQPEVELVISAAGEVESIRLASGHTSALSAMQISAIKAWRFEPATRDGQPVRCRLQVRIPSQ